ncbi:MAG: pilus assembly protein PilM [Deltaproteobacteria bacterium]|nr:pilus assembly protein PilM [Deltaproteobacteria bacterium]
MTIVTGIRQKMNAWWLRRHRGRLGVDLQGSTVRVVHTRPLSQGGVELVSFGSIEIDPFHADDISLSVFRQFLARQAGKSRIVALGLEHESLRIRRMDLPPMPDADFREALRWNFREHVDCPPEAYHVDALPLPGLPPNGVKPVLAFGVAEAAIRERVELVERWNFKLGWLEPAATAIMQVFSTNDLLAHDRTMACLVLDETTALLTVMRDSALLFSRPLVIGNLTSLAQLVLQEGGTAATSPGALVKRWLSEKESLNVDARPVMERFMSELVVDIERSLNAFSLQYGTESINDIFVCGAALASPGLLEHIHSSLGTPVSMIDPFAKITLATPVMDDPQERSRYTVAMGLSLL